MLIGDPRADPAVVDLIELAGLWLAAGDRAALQRCLRRLVDLLGERYPADHAFRERFADVLRQTDADEIASEELPRSYRRATLG